MQRTTFTLTITTENAAFEPDPIEEVARILKVARDRLIDGQFDCILHDANGNRVGSYHLA